MVLKMNQQRFLTIAGSASLVAIAAFGIWKWSKHVNTAPEKRKTKDRQVDKDLKQSHSSVSVKESIKKPEIGDKENETTEKVLSEKVSIETAPTEKVELKASQPIIKIEQESTDKVEQVTEVETTTTTATTETETETTTNEMEQPKEIQSKEEIVVELKETVESKDIESSQEVMMETIVLAEEDKQVKSVEEEEYVMVGKVIKKQESQSCATSSGDETGVWTPEHEPEMKDNTPKNATTKEYIWKADSYVAPITDEQKNWSSPVTSPVTTTTTTTPTTTTTTSPKPLSSDAAVFVPRRQVQPKKSLRRRLTRPELIQQQRQNYTPHAKARCSHWPCCTNKNCKFWHPFRDCREGEDCPFGNKCMFIHPADYLEPVRGNPTVTQEEEE